MIFSETTPAFAQFASDEAYEQSAPRSLVIEKTMVGHTVKLIAKLRKFDRARHRLGSSKDAPNVLVTIDGQRILGGDGGFLASEIDQQYEFEFLRVFLDGREIPIDRKWYNNCLRPLLTSDRFLVTIGDDLRSVFAFMQGSDAAGTYDVIWIFRPDGNHSRMTFAGSDSSILHSVLVPNAGLESPVSRAIMTK